MSFQQGLSGLSAASRNLDVIGNNIANSDTIGAKSIRAEFADLYASALNRENNDNRGGVGIGVQVVGTAQDFSQGNIKTTTNPLDLAISGGGFFQVARSDGSTAYTRNGEFKLDKSGYVVTSGNENLMGFKYDTQGRVVTTAEKLQVQSSGQVGGTTTSTAGVRVNLDAKSAPFVPATGGTAFDQNVATAMTVYDSLGTSSPMRVYFTKGANPNEWHVNAHVGLGTVTDANTPRIGTLNFNPATGALSGATDGTGAALTDYKLKVNIPAPAGSVANPAAVPPVFADANGVLVTEALVDFASSSQHSTSFVVNELSQNGFASGEFTGLAVAADGTIKAKYSNGREDKVGQVMLASFTNPQGLSQLGGNLWSETVKSGQATRGSPGSGSLGSIQAAALEQSNVDLTAELVNMMVVQRSYQANVQTIKTQDQVITSLINMR